MKSIRIVLAGVFFLLGIPAGLLISGVTFQSIFRDIEELRRLMDINLLVQVIFVVSLWLVWMYGLVSLTIELIRSVRHGFDPSKAGIFHRAASVFLFALWLLVNQSHQSNFVAPIDKQVQGVDKKAADLSVDVRESSISPSLLAFAALLAMYEVKERRKLQLALAGMKVPVRSKSFQINWATLRFKKQGLRLRVDNSEMSKARGQFRAWLMGPDFLFEPIPISGKCDEAKAHVPIGVIGNRTLFISVGEKTEIAVVGDHSENVIEVSRYLRTFLQASGLENAMKNHDIDSSGTVRVKKVSDQWVLFPGEIVFTPFSITDAEESAFAQLNSEIEKPLEITGNFEPRDKSKNWTLCVRIMGPVEVVNQTWETVHFEKSKSQELLTWLVLHRERPTRIAARTALWGMSVQDATFNNVVSGLRKAVKTNSPDLLSRGGNDSLIVNSDVITDHEMLVSAIHSVNEEINDKSIEKLTYALSLVRDLPFAGQDYVWADAEGITSNIVLSIVSGALILAEHHLANNDLEKVFWATGKGLQSLRGHEPLIALRMKAHAKNQNISGINAEWNAYERIRIADDNFYDRKSNGLSSLRDSLISSA